jgi:hypothetical protein
MLLTKVLQMVLRASLEGSATAPATEVVALALIDDACVPTIGVSLHPTDYVPYFRHLPASLLSRRSFPTKTSQTLHNRFGILAVGKVKKRRPEVPGNPSGREKPPDSARFPTEETMPDGRK